MIHITHHACDRYRERVGLLSDEAIADRLDTPAIQAAVAFGAGMVRLGCGARLVIKNGCVVTVLPRDHFARQIMRRGLGRYGKSMRFREGGEHA